jgi:hypothetical protein
MDGDAGTALIQVQSSNKTFSQGSNYKIGRILGIALHRARQALRV